MTFSTYLDNNDSVLEAMDKQCKPSLTKATQLRCDIIALHPELRAVMAQLDNAYMEYADSFAEQHIVEAEKFYKHG